MSSHPHHISPLQRVRNHTKPPTKPLLAALLFRAFFEANLIFQSFLPVRPGTFFPRRLGPFRPRWLESPPQSFLAKWNNISPSPRFGTLKEGEMISLPKKLPSLGFFLVVWGGDETFDQNHVIFKLGNPELNTFKLCHDCILGEGENVPAPIYISDTGGVFFFSVSPKKLCFQNLLPSGKTNMAMKTHHFIIGDTSSNGPFPSQLC